MCLFVSVTTNMFLRRKEGLLLPPPHATPVHFNQNLKPKVPLPAFWNITPIFRSKYILFLISNFRRVQYVLCFLLGNYSPASEFYTPTFRNAVQSSQAGRCAPTPTCLWRWNSVPKRRHIKFRRRGLTQKKTFILFSVIHYNVNNI